MKDQTWIVVSLLEIFDCPCQIFFKRQQLESSSTIISKNKSNRYQKQVENQQLAHVQRLQSMLNANLTSGYSSRSYKKGKIRFLFLFLIVLVAFGNQYAFNNPQALEETLYEHLDITQTQFQLFYSLYSLPNIFTLLFIGYFLDKFGMRIGIVVLSFAIVIFQLLFAIGGQIGSFGLMLTARVLFGIASRSIFIPQASLISFWFKGRQLSFALGIGITCPELGNALNSYLTPLIYEATGSLGPPLFTSVAICALGFGCAVMVSKIDKQAEQEDINNDIRSEISEYSLDTIESKHEKIKLSDLKELNNTFWIVSILCTLTMTQYIPFLDNANRLFQKRFCFTQTTAGEVITVTYIATALFSGPLGILVNKVGHRRFFIMGATVIFFIAHTIIWAYPQCDGQAEYATFWGLLLIGIGYSFYANVIVAAIPMVVQRKVLGSAIGIMEIISSLAECLVPLATARMIQNSESKEEGFKQSSFFFFLIGAVGVLTSLSLFFIERKMKKRLDKGEGKVVEPQFLDEIEIPSEYRRIQDDARSSFPVSSQKPAKRQISSGIELASRQLY